MNKNSKFLLALGLGFLAAFLGALVAFLLVFEHFAKNSPISFVQSKQLSSHWNDVDFPNERLFTDIDKQINDIIKETQTFHSKFGFKSKLYPAIPSTIKSEEDSDSYKITVNLKSFGNDENNVKVNIKDNKVTVSAKYENKKDDKVFNSSSFYQSLTLPEKIDASKVKKEKLEDNLIITIPKSTDAKSKNVKSQELYKKFHILDKNYI